MTKNMKTKLTQPPLARRIGITPEQELALHVCASCMENYPKETIWGYNVEHIRVIHDKHFPDTECFACVMIMCQFYSQLMGGTSVNAYFELRGHIDGIMKELNRQFKDYEGKSIKSPSHS